MEWLQATAGRAWQRAGVGVRGLLGLGVLVSALWAAPARAADVRTVYDVQGQIIAIA